MKLLILDSDGMVGHVVSRYLLECGHKLVQYKLRDIVLNCFNKLENSLLHENFDAVINCAAVINQNAEHDKTAAVTINSLLPHYLAEITKDTKTVIVHRSTDCIYSGKKGSYTLDDWPDANSFYARTKALGELNNEKDITIRTSLIGPETDKNGIGLFNWFYNQQGNVNGFANSIWTGITTIEFAREIEWLLKNKKHGVFQLVPDHAIGKYDLLLLFEKYYPGNRNIIRIENEKVDKSLVKISEDLFIPSYEFMIADMRKWTDNHPTLYRYK